MIILLVLLVGCSPASSTNMSTNVATDEAVITSSTTGDVEYKDMSIEELCEFLADFTEKLYAPKSQTDIDVAVGDAIGVIDVTAMFHFLLSLPKEINQEKYVKITHISYGIGDGASDLTSNIIVAFDLYLHENYSTSKYVRFDFDDENVITKIKEYSALT